MWSYYTYLSGISCIVAGMSTSVRTFKKVTENDSKLPLAIYSLMSYLLRLQSDKDREFIQNKAIQPTVHISPNTIR